MRHLLISVLAWRTSPPSHDLFSLSPTSWQRFRLNLYSARRGDSYSAPVLSVIYPPLALKLLEDIYSRAWLSSQFLGPVTRSLMFRYDCGRLRDVGADSLCKFFHGGVHRVHPISFAFVLILILRSQKLWIQREYNTSKSLNILYGGVPRALHQL